MMSPVSPGPRERQLRRRKAFPDLFHAAPPDEAAFSKARADDEAQAGAFAETFSKLVSEAVALRPNEESERILGLKARLDHAYALAACLGGDRSAEKQAIRRLIDLIMQAVRRGAGTDATALAELEDEALARDHHMALLEQPLVADLMLPDSPVSEEELVPTLLSESAEAVEAVLWLFEPEQLAEISASARALLAALDARGVHLQEPRSRLAQLELGAASRN